MNPHLHHPVDLPRRPAIPASRLQTRWRVPDLERHGLHFYEVPVVDFLDGMWVRAADGQQMLMMGSYSYLGLARTPAHPRISRAVATAMERFGTGCNGVRLLAGTVGTHLELERHLAEFTRTEAAITFSSGWAANVSTIACLLGRFDTVICDKLDHASIVDGCALSGARMMRFRHNDLQDLERCLQRWDGDGIALVVVDAVYSMDGDIADVPGVLALCKRYGAALMVDEAHSIGVLGATGRGIEEHFDLPPGAIDLKMGTLSKAIPSSGGYVACAREVRTFLANHARGFIYSGALTPIGAAAADAALSVIESEPGRVEALQQNQRRFTALLRERSIDFLDSPTAIFPILCGGDVRAFRVARECRLRGVYVQAIPSPVVPRGKARLRAAVTATHTEQDLRMAAEVFREALDLVPPDDTRMKDWRP